MPKKPARLPSDPFSARESNKYEQPIASREYLLNIIESYSVPVPQEQIAEIMSIKTGTVKALIFQARQKLITWLSD